MLEAELQIPKRNWRMASSWDREVRQWMDNSREWIAETCIGERDVDLMLQTKGWRTGEFTYLHCWDIGCKYMPDTQNENLPLNLQCSSKVTLHSSCRREILHIHLIMITSISRTCGRPKWKVSRRFLYPIPSRLEYFLKAKRLKYWNSLTTTRSTQLKNYYKLPRTNESQFINPINIIYPATTGFQR